MSRKRWRTSTADSESEKQAGPASSWGVFGKKKKMESKRGSPPTRTPPPICIWLLCIYTGACFPCLGSHIQDECLVDSVFPSCLSHSPPTSANISRCNFLYGLYFFCASSCPRKGERRKKERKHIGNIYQIAIPRNNRLFLF